MAIWFWSDARGKFIDSVWLRVSVRVKFNLTSKGSASPRSKSRAKVRAGIRFRVIFRVKISFKVLVRASA